MNNFDDISIPVYIISAKNSIGLPNINEQFQGKTEFQLNFIEANPNDFGLALQSCAQSGLDNDDDVIIICNDLHVFTENYERTFFIQHIFEAHKQKCDVLSGGLGRFNQAVPITKNLYWVDRFWYCNFIVVFRKCFIKILNKPYEDKRTIADSFSRLTTHKMVLYPFISSQLSLMSSFSENSNIKMFQKIIDFFCAASVQLSIYEKAYKEYGDNL